MKLSKIEKKGDWVTWPNTTLTNINLFDCDDTEEGVCPVVSTIEQCMEKASSGFGYFLELPDGRRICTPLRLNDIYFVNPTYFIRPKDIYQQFNNVNSTVFMNTKMHNYPPDLANQVFYTDPFYCYEVTTGKYIGSNISQPTHRSVATLSERPLELQFMTHDRSQLQMEKYFPVTYWDNVSFSIPDTNMGLSTDVDYEYLEWRIFPSVLNAPNTGFQVVPLNLDTNNQKNLTYEDTFLLKSNEGFLVYNKSRKSLEVSRNNAQALLSNDTYGCVFGLESRVQGFYCENGVCKQIPISRTKTNGASAMYKNSKVSRSPYCWGECERKGIVEEEDDLLRETETSTTSTSNSSVSTGQVILVVVLLIVGVILYFMLRTRV